MDPIARQLALYALLGAILVLARWARRRPPPQPPRARTLIGHAPARRPRPERSRPDPRIDTRRNSSP